MASSGDLSVGSVIRFDGELCRVEEYMHRTPGNLRAFYQARMRNLKTGKLVENRFRVGEAVELVRVEYKMMQYIYPEGEFIVCMNTETYDQIHIPAFLIGDAIKFLKEGMDVKVSFEGDEPILAEAPVFVELVITYTEPGERGNTATNTLKPATLETGAIVKVPLFINEGEKIKVDTRTSEYVERVK
ncbi:MAG: elongation factor P [Bacteroidia bacterium]